MTKNITQNENSWVVPYRNQTVTYVLDETLTVIADVHFTPARNMVRLSFKQKGKTSTRIEIDTIDFYSGGFKEFFELYFKPLEEKNVNVIYDTEIKNLIKETDPSRSFPVEKEETVIKKKEEPTIDKVPYFLISIVLDAIVVGLFLLQLFKPFSEDKKLATGDISMMITLGIVFVAVPTIMFISYRKRKKALTK